MMPAPLPLSVQVPSTGICCLTVFQPATDCIQWWYHRTHLASFLTSSLAGVTCALRAFCCAFPSGCLPSGPARHSEALPSCLSRLLGLTNAHDDSVCVTYPRHMTHTCTAFLSRHGDTIMHQDGLKCGQRNFLWREIKFIL